MPLAGGDQFAGYIIQRMLGSGGMGEVYLAQHPRLPRLYALKVMSASLTGDAEFRERFNREAELAATLWHPHIVGVHDRGEFDGQLWIAMDYVDGIDASRLVHERFAGTGMPEHEVVEIVTAIADALDYAHERHLLHRDVKPANILLTESEPNRRRTMLADFGIARRSDDISGLTATNMAVGSVAYAAPEQLMGEPIDGRADQYALAATAFQLLTGKPLFAHSNPAVVIGRHLTAPPPRLQDHRAQLAPLDAVLSVALAKDPADRYRRCQDFAQALADATTTAANYGPAPPADLTTPADLPMPAASFTPAVPSVPFAPAWPLPPQPPRRPTLAGILVPLLLTMLLLAASTFAGTQFFRSGPSTAPQWQPYVDFARQFAVSLTSLSPQSADSDVQRILDESTGQFLDDFAKMRSDFTKVVQNSNVTEQGTVNSAGLESINGTTAQVLVAATSKVTNSAGAQQDPRSFRLIIYVEKIGDTYKASKVEFVP